MRGQPRSRASDEQRTAVWEWLDAAVLDGRLDPLEHLERTRAIPSSRYVDELRVLIADLPDDHDDPGPGESQRGGGTQRTSGGSNTRGQFTYEAGNGRQLAYLPPGREPRGPARLRGRGPLIAAGALSLGVMAIIVSALLSPVDDDPGPSSPSGGGATAAQALAHSTSPEPLHSLDGMTRLLEAARVDFGDHQIENLYVRGDTAILTHSAPVAPEAIRQHRFRGRWQPVDDTPPAPVDRRPFDVASIDPAAVVAALADAPERLGTVGASTTDVVIHQHESHGLVYGVTVLSDGQLSRALYDARGQLLELTPPG